LGKFIPKIPILAIWEAVGQYFLSHNGEILQEGEDLGLPPQAKFGIKKSHKGVYPFLAKLYQKLAILAILPPVSPHFKSHNPKVCREATDLVHPPHA